jgi:hypothetical protein
MMERVRQVSINFLSCLAHPSVFQGGTRDDITVWASYPNYIDNLSKTNPPLGIPKSPSDPWDILMIYSFNAVKP